MCICMCLCVYICVLACLHECVYMCMPVLCVCTHIYACLNVCVCMWICVFICIVCLKMRVHACVCVYPCVYACMYVCFLEVSEASLYCSRELKFGEFVFLQAHFELHEWGCKADPFPRVCGVLYRLISFSDCGDPSTPEVSSLLSWVWETKQTEIQERPN